MPIDRNARTKIVWQAEAHERRTKLKGKRGGDIGPSGIQILRLIAFKFFDLTKGCAWPSLDALQAASGLCRQTVVNAIKRLKAAGFVFVQRRTRFEGGRLIKLTNLYRLPIEAPPLPEWESLFSGRDSKSPESTPWEQWQSPLKDALESLAKRMGLTF